MYIAFMDTSAADAASEKAALGTPIVSTATPPDLQALTLIPVSQTIKVTSILILGTIGLSWGFAAHQGVVAKGELPLISDLWVYIPGDWFSRWGVMLTSTLLCVSLVSFYTLEFPTTKPAGVDLALVATAVGIVAAVALGMTGIINEQENTELHLGAATVFNLGLDVYMIFALVASLFMAAPATGRWARVLRWALWFVSMVANVRVRSVARFLTHIVHEHHGCAFSSHIHAAARGELPPGVYAVYEWVDLLVLLAFFNLSGPY